MKAPNVVPEAVTKALVVWSKFHSSTIVKMGDMFPKLEWDSLNGCYYFWASNMYHGVELDGHIHT